MGRPGPDHLKFIQCRLSLGFHPTYKSYNDVIKFLKSNSCQKTVDDQYDKVISNLKSASIESNDEVIKIVDILKDCIYRIEDTYNMNGINFIWAQPYNNRSDLEYMYHGYFFREINQDQREFLRKMFKEEIHNSYQFNGMKFDNPIEELFD